MAPMLARAGVTSVTADGVTFTIRADFPVLEQILTEQANPPEKREPPVEGACIKCGRMVEADLPPEFSQGKKCRRCSLGIAIMKPRAGVR
jgi:hypothetical protein